MQDIHFGGITPLRSLPKRIEAAHYNRVRLALPLLTWMNFQVEGRSVLHEPVICTLHLYHYHAGLIMGKVLDALIEELDRRLQQ